MQNTCWKKTKDGIKIKNHRFDSQEAEIKLKGRFFDLKKIKTIPVLHWHVVLLLKNGKDVIQEDVRIFL